MGLADVYTYIALCFRLPYLLVRGVTAVRSAKRVDNGRIE